MDKFRDEYAALYNSPGSQTDMLELRQKIKQMLGFCSVEEIAKITGKVVKEAAFSMQPGKGDVSCGFT